MISPGLSSCEHSLNTLRYADRVKELDASDPAAEEVHAPMYSSPPSRSPNRSRNLQDVSMVDDDLAALRSLNVSILILYVIFIYFIFLNSYKI